MEGQFKLTNLIYEQDCVKNCLCVGIMQNTLNPGIVSTSLDYSSASRSNLFCSTCNSISSARSSYPCHQTQTQVTDNSERTYQLPPNTTVFKHINIANPFNRIGTPSGSTFTESNNDAAIFKYLTTVCKVHHYIFTYKVQKLFSTIHYIVL